MPNLDIYRVDLDTPQPNGRLGESPRAAFTKYNDMLEVVLDGTDKQANLTDTTAGKLLTVGSFGLGFAIALATEDLNTVVVPGTYQQGTTANATLARNYPIAANGVLSVTSNSSSGTSGKQQTFHAHVSNRIFTRTLASTVWSPWSEVYTQGNILGTVSQSGGVPTGALLQYISNANGECFRYAGGQQFWRFQTSATGPVSNPAGPLFYTGAAIPSRTFTVPFIAPPSVIFSINGGPVAISAGGPIAVSSANSGQFYHLSDANRASATYTYMWQAAGRWFLD